MSDGDGVISHKYAYLLKPVTNLEKNFNIDISKSLARYIEDIKELEERDALDVASSNKKFNFAEAGVIVRDSAGVYGRKVDYVHDCCHQFSSQIMNMRAKKNRDGDGDQDQEEANEGEEVGRRKGRKRILDPEEHYRLKSLPSLSSAGHEAHHKRLSTHTCAVFKRRLNCPSSVAAPGELKILPALLRPLPDTEKEGIAVIGHHQRRIEMIGKFEDFWTLSPNVTVPEQPWKSEFERTSAPTHGPVYSVNGCNGCSDHNCQWQGYFAYSLVNKAIKHLYTDRRTGEVLVPKRRNYCPLDNILMLHKNYGEDFKWVTTKSLIPRFDWFIENKQNALENKEDMRMAMGFVYYRLGMSDRPPTSQQQFSQESSGTDGGIIAGSHMELLRRTSSMAFDLRPSIASDRNTHLNATPLNPDPSNDLGIPIDEDWATSNPDFDGAFVSGRAFTNLPTMVPCLDINSNESCSDEDNIPTVQSNVCKNDHGWRENCYEPWSKQWDSIPLPTPPKRDPFKRATDVKTVPIRLSKNYTRAKLLKERFKKVDSEEKDIVDRVCGMNAMFEMEAHDGFTLDGNVFSDRKKCFVAERISDVHVEVGRFAVALCRSHVRGVSLARRRHSRANRANVSESWLRDAAACALRAKEAEEIASKHADLEYRVGSAVDQDDVFRGAHPGDPSACGRTPFLDQTDPDLGQDMSLNIPGDNDPDYEDDIPVRTKFRHIDCSVFADADRLNRSLHSRGPSRFSAMSRQEKYAVENMEAAWKDIEAEMERKHQLEVAMRFMKEINPLDDLRTELQDEAIEWEEKLLPLLKQEEGRSDFDIHDTGTDILSLFSHAGEVKHFRELVIGKERHEISRYFLSTLMMANTMNVELSDGQNRRGLDDADCTNNLEVRLLCLDRPHERANADGAV